MLHYDGFTKNSGLEFFEFKEELDMAELFLFNQSFLLWYDKKSLQI